MMQTVETLTHLGLGRTDQDALVPRVLPGEVIEVEEDAVRIVTPSTDRVAAPCPHYKRCGGCAVQHASDPFVAGWKQSVVAHGLQARGLTPDFRPIHTSPPHSRRRAKFSGRRTKKGAMVGFHVRGSDMLIAVPQCQLLTPALMATLPALEELTTMAASRKSEIGLTVTDTLGGPDILIDTDMPLTPQLRIDLAGFAQRHRVARLTWVDEPVVTLQNPVQMFAGIAVVPTPGSFLQATVDGEEALRRAVVDIVAGADRIVDLFAGCGTFGLPLAAGAEVHAVEGEAPLIAALDRGWRNAKGLKKVTTEVRDLFRRPLEPDELRFDAAVIDPPRAGAAAQVERLAQSDIGRIAMVSCNPVTFARDAETLVAGGYGLDWVQVVDQFRWSAHVEMVGKFTRL